MKKLLIIIITFAFVVACGVKGSPEYKSQGGHNKVIQIV